MWRCDAVYFEAELFAGIDEGVDISKRVEHPYFTLAPLRNIFRGHSQSVVVLDYFFRANVDRCTKVTHFPFRTNPRRDASTQQEK